jgi:hypothetical protein
VTTAAVTAAGVGENEKFAGAGIVRGTFLAPPVGNSVSGEGGSIVGNSDHKGAAVFGEVIDDQRRGGDGIPSVGRDF